MKTEKEALVRGAEPEVPDPLRDKRIADAPSAEPNGLPYGDRSDADLVACLASEGGDAYAELYRRHCASVTAATRMILFNDDRCQDVVAEVFVGLWFFPERFEPSRGSLLTFLRMRARGRSIDIVRADTTRKRRERCGGQTDADHQQDSDTVLIGTENALLVREALTSLPPSEREPIYMAFFKGLSYREVARRLELPEGTVKTRIRAGLRQLQSDVELQRLRELDPGATTNKAGFADPDTP